MAKKNVKDVELKGKKVLVRADFNVPMKDGAITNDNRIVQALPTIKYIIEQGGKVILFSHLGKVKTEEDKQGLSLKPVAERLSELLNKEETFVPE
ncbi:phosphoglycerate kinase, partial [Mammaliicoccus sciuri]|uniref:phosphoglycerate kinase n=1 Tax=Mammaliicoccus sciuri TaxID=1296 RepID=UPI0022714104